MSSSLSFITDATGQCGICLNSLDSPDRQVVAHEGEGSRHPMHATCLQVWLRSGSTCPTCRVELNPSLFIPYSEQIQVLSQQFFNAANKEAQELAGVGLGGIAAGAITFAIIPLARVIASPTAKTIGMGLKDIKIGAALGGGLALAKFIIEKTGDTGAFLGGKAADALGLGEYRREGKLLGAAGGAVTSGIILIPNGIKFVSYLMP